MCKNSKVDNTNVNVADEMKGVLERYEIAYGCFSLSDYKLENFSPYKFEVERTLFIDKLRKENTNRSKCERC